MNRNHCRMTKSRLMTAVKKCGAKCTKMWSAVSSPSTSSYKDDHKFKTPAVPPRRLKDRPHEVLGSRKPRSSLPTALVGRLPDPLGENRSARGLGEPSTLDLETLYKEADAEVTRVNFNGDLLLLPSILVHSDYIFRQVVSIETYYSLSEEARNHLRQFLPPIKTVAEEQHALACAFTKRTDLVHGNPIERVQSKLKSCLATFDVNKCSMFPISAANGS
ncbi:hypothetical protein ANCCAN_16594 [Ancylostoma caninum]|uniref:Uncharacterized protein n=1 Tax=Ancylostoma caninum TaxID=29170 RepID=A0A368FZ87_ANCCA|nr:hypothetical protein ANCCAN_16594 [Ancylostoma caninum]